MLIRSRLGGGLSGSGYRFSHPGQNQPCLISFICEITDFRKQPGQNTPGFVLCRRIPALLSKAYSSKTEDRDSASVFFLCLREKYHTPNSQSTVPIDKHDRIILAGRVPMALGMPAAAKSHKRINIMAAANADPNFF